MIASFTDMHIPHKLHNMLNPELEAYTERGTVPGLVLLAQLIVGDTRDLTAIACPLPVVSIACDTCSSRWLIRLDRVRALLIRKRGRGMRKRRCHLIHGRIRRETTS